MDPRIVMILVAAVAVIAILCGVLIANRSRSRQLKQEFGPEYDRALMQHGDVYRAEAALTARRRRVSKLPIRALTPVDRERYAADWLDVQRQFVDDPSTAVTRADKLVTSVMAARGYPMGDFEQRAADISVHYPMVVQNYRAARQISLRHAHGESSTEDLRRAMIYYHSLFDELLGLPKSLPIGVTHERIAS